ncbi:MAG: HigA family addiction module antitoxin [Candidatus Electronema sp. V4]|uniref:HigA family addiction module antitoxin n=1 Tax=Candidatus Electronema sp. V4 TaxID=3454756 RepID=UPI00405578D6
MAELIPPEHPGIIVKEEFIEAFSLTQDEVAAQTGIPQDELTAVTAGKMELSPVSALKLAKFFGMSESYFFNLAARYSLDLAKEKAQSSLAKIIPFRRKEAASSRAHT